MRVMQVSAWRRELASVACMHKHKSRPKAEGPKGPLPTYPRRGCCLVPDPELCVGFAPVASFSLNPLVFWTQSFWLSPSLSHFLRDATRCDSPIQAEPKEWGQEDALVSVQGLSQLNITTLLHTYAGMCHPHSHNLGVTITEPPFPVNSLKSVRR